MILLAVAVGAVIALVSYHLGRNNEVPKLGMDKLIQFIHPAKDNNKGAEKQPVSRGM